MPTDYLKTILTARVYDVAVETALEVAPHLSRRLGNHGAAQARGHAAGLQLQAARRLQQDGPPGARRSCARGVICASAGNHAQGVALRGRAARLPRGDRDAGDHAAGSRSTPCTRSAARSCCTATATPTPTRHALELEKAAGPDLRPSVRRPGRDRRPGHDRDGDPAPAPGADRRGLRRHRRRRPDLRRRRVHQGGAARDQGHRRADDRLRRDDAVGRRPASASTLADVGLFSDGTAVKLVGAETFRARARAGRRLS